MTSDEITRYVVAAAAVVEIDVRPEWMPNVVKFFEIAQTMAGEVIGTGALREFEAASVFTPRPAE
jgi:Protein of unknown function (DUF4089)